MHRLSPDPIPAATAATPATAPASAAPVQLNTLPNWSLPGARYFHSYTPGDDFYEMLTSAHQPLNDEQSQAFNARLILLLANHIGDMSVLRQAIAIAAHDLPGQARSAAAAAHSNASTIALTPTGPVV